MIEYQENTIKNEINQLLNLNFAAKNAFIVTYDHVKSINDDFDIANIQMILSTDSIKSYVTIYYDGYHGDNNLTVFYGPPKHEPVKKMADLAQQALYKAISICRPGTFCII